MIINNVELETVAVRRNQYPQTGLPEVAFVGRSNVGKSSLINTMLGRKKLARTSQNPGKTRTINFYNVESMLYFVDLPGYGYAKISKSEREKWGKMIEEYLKTREELRSVVLLVDIRHAPSKDDAMMFEWLRYYDIEYKIAATKLDKIKRSQVSKHLSVIMETLGVKKNDIIAFSSETKAGREELWSYIRQISFSELNE